MNQKAILIVALRVTALILLVTSIDDIGKLLVRDVPMLEFGGYNDNPLEKKLVVDYSVLLPFLAKVLLIIILWFFPTLLLNKISGLPKEDVYPTAESFIMPLVSIIGLYFVASSIIGLLTVIFMPMFGQGVNITAFFLIPMIIEFAVGLWLLLGNKGLVGLIYKLRSTKVS
ncbi:hypothetical protein [Kangiella marina]|uniref:DUF2975 domain-containing protein n=1 Tax=Kangiella marina TaxID=1079178 RepID=A0ABP8IJI0_9GAMM